MINISKDAKSPEYIKLNSGDKLIRGDEYSGNGTWREIPPCLVGDKIPNSTTQWRRRADLMEKENSKKKKWFGLF